MKKLTNMIGSYIVAVAIIACPIITGIGMNSGWLERENDVLIHPGLALFWLLCLTGTIAELVVLALLIRESE